MATVYRDVGLQLKTCPYNPAHKVKASRFQAHVSNCAQQYSMLGLKECPFNSTHRIPEDKFAEHIVVCSDNRLLFQSNLSKTVKEKNETKDEEEDYRMKGKDIWSDQYVDTSSAKNYDVLCDTNVTAERVFNQRFKETKNTFTDCLYVQKMSYEERKKYQSMCVQRIKQMNDTSEEDTDQTIVPNLTEQQMNDEEMAPQTDQDVQIIDFRAPNIQNPFSKGVNNPSVDSNDQNVEKVRGAGIGRGYRGKGVSYRRDIN